MLQHVLDGKKLRLLRGFVTLREQELAVAGEVGEKRRISQGPGKLAEPISLPKVGEALVHVCQRK
jgi:hypothetical protein